MKPADLMLPEKFGEFRHRQIETAAKINASPKFTYMLDAPTGSGKSLIAAIVQRLMKQNVCYVCTTKQLQDQLMHDFPYAATVKGRNNYVCLRYPKMFPEISAEECNHSDTTECPYYSRCPYILAKKAARAAPIGVLNTAYFLSEVNFVGMFRNYDLLIIDEFDTLEDQLMSHVEVQITKRQLERLNYPPPKFKTKFESWVEWARPALTQFSAELRQMEKDLENRDAWTTDDLSVIRRKRDVGRLVTKLTFFVREVDQNWIWLPGDDKWVFKPVWVAKYADNAVWKHAKRVLGMSATVLDPRQMSLNVGLNLSGKTFEYLQMASPFPKENRPVHYEPCADVTRKNMDIALPMLAKSIKAIMEKHPDEKILIHTVSYKIRDFLVGRLDANRILTHSTADRIDKLELFKQSKKPLVLISPSMDRGVDLPEEECRVVVIAKIPYPDLGDLQVSRRVHASKDGNNWYAHKTVSSIVQMAGRGVRSETDYAITYILDRQFEKVYKEHKGMFPMWFKEAVIM